MERESNPDSAKLSGVYAFINASIDQMIYKCIDKSDDLN
jgi:hypothetical protein